MEQLPLSFYARPAAEVAPALLGKVFVHQTSEGRLAGRIVETEAYTGQSDPGSHAYRGLTSRTRVMFGPPGHLYVYFTYGAHFCVNVVTDSEGVAGAVLIRALEPLDGVDVMWQHRGERPRTELCNGPGKLCQALGITRQHNGIRLGDGELWIENDGLAVDRVCISTRVGLSAGKELPLRFYLPDSPYVSRGRPSGGK